MYKLLCWSSGKAGGILNAEHYFERGEIPFALHSRTSFSFSGVGDDKLFRVFFIFILFNSFFLIFFLVFIYTFSYFTISKFSQFITAIFIL